MRGQVLGVDARTGHGLLAGDDGLRYTFLPHDWAHKGEPAIGQTVDFETQDGRALNIFPLAMPSSAPAEPALVARDDRNKYVAAALALFFGALGVHRFYTGRTASGALMLVLSLTVFGLIVTGPLSLIDAIRYLMMSDTEFARRYPRR